MKNRGKKFSRACDLTILIFFPAIYGIYNSSAQKNRHEFSHVRVWIKLCRFSTSNIFLYINAAALCKQTGRLRTSVVARIGYRYILSIVDVISAEIGTGGATWL